MSRPPRTPPLLDLRARAGLLDDLTDDLTGLERMPLPGVRLHHVIDVQSDRVTRLAWAPDGRRIAVPSRDGEVRLHDAESGELLAALEGHGSPVMGVAWAPDGRRLASIGGDDTLRVWSCRRAAMRESIRCPEGSLTGVAWSPDGRMLVATSEAGHVLRWHDRATPGRALPRLAAGQALPNPGALHASWSPDGRHLAVGSRSGTVRLWDPWSASLLGELDGHEDASVVTAWSPDGTRVASGAKDGTVRIWTTGAGSTHQRLDGHDGEVRAIAWHPDGALLATKSGDGWVRLLRPDPWRTVAAIPEAAPAVGWSTGLAFHPRRPLLATLGEGDRVVRVWALEPDRLPRDAIDPESVRARREPFVRPAGRRAWVALV